MMIKSLPLLAGASATFLTLGVLLVRVIARLLRSNRAQWVASGPLVAEQEFAIRDSGELLLLIEVPRFGSDFRELEFEVVEKATERATRMRYDFLRAQGAVYGVTTMRVPLGRVALQRPGSYLVRITGLQPGADHSGSRIIFSRPYLARMVLQIIGIVVCAIGMLLGLLLALWQVLPLAHG